jgi:3' terminal RNA ribose 2'-O-methyltransferase Hen1
LDNNKHYYISKDEIEKLIHKGGDWLQDHPAKNYIVRRYFKKKYGFGNEAFNRLNELKAEEETDEEENTEPKEVKEKRISLHNQRLNLVTEEIIKADAKTVVDLGCGEGKLLQRLIPIQGISKIVGMDISFQTLQAAKRRLHMENMSAIQLKRIDLIHGALTYRDKRIEGFDCATLVEVIEHLDEPRLEALERVVFEFAKPKTVILTTPNGEYNIMYENLVNGHFRHNDHRFEWSRKEFKEWAFRVANTNGYEVTFENVGEEDEKVGSPSQMATFRLK